MKKWTLLNFSIFLTLFSLAQNVGVGTTNPVDGKLQVESAGASGTQAMFTNGTTGISILTDANRPSIGFNMNFNAGFKFKGTGWGGLFWYLPNSGNFHYYSSNASGSAGNNVVFGSSLLTIQPDGNVGIGATPSEARLQVHDPAGNTQFIAAAGNNLPGISTFVPTSAPSVGFNVRYNSGYKFMGSGYGGFWQFSPSLGKLYYYNSTTTGVADGNVSSSLAMTIDSDGQLGIGTSVPKAPLHVTGNVVFGSSSINPASGYKVSVDGKIIVEEARVQLSGSWPDYVFASDYKLPTLKQLETFIKTNKHLPNIPSAAEVQKEKGFDLGDIQKRLLEKVEELTLYIIELKKENESLQQRIEKLEAKELR